MTCRRTNDGTTPTRTVVQQFSRTSIGAANKNTCTNGSTCMGVPTTERRCCETTKDMNLNTRAGKQKTSTTEQYEYAIPRETGAGVISQRVMWKTKGTHRGSKETLSGHDGNVCRNTQWTEPRKKTARSALMAPQGSVAHFVQRFRGG